MLIFLDILIVIVLIGAFVYWTRRKWKTIRPLVYDDNNSPEKDGATEKKGGISERMSKDNWIERFHSGLFQTIDKIGEIKNNEILPVVEVINNMRKNYIQLLDEKTHDLMLKIMEIGTLQSILLDVGGMYIYILVFPGLHDQPVLLKRYSPFVHGLVSHIEELRKALQINEAKVNLIQLIIFLSPNLREGTMHLAFQNSSLQLFPVDLLDKSEKANLKGVLYESRQVF
jgi:hypothetical protein